MSDDDGHLQMDMDKIKDLSIKNGELYWKKQLLKTETIHHFVLSKFQFVGALILGIAGVSAPILTYVSQLHNICPNTNDSFPFCADWKARQPVATPASSGNVNPASGVNAGEPVLVRQPAAVSPRKPGTGTTKSATKQ